MPSRRAFRQWRWIEITFTQDSAPKEPRRGRAISPVHDQSLAAGVAGIAMGEDMRHFGRPTPRKLMLICALSGLTLAAIPPEAWAQSRGRGEAQRMVDEAQIAEDWLRRIQPNWAQYSQSLLRELNRLTPQELARTTGGRAEVISAIQDRYNLSNERASDRLTAWQMRQR